MHRTHVLWTAALLATISATIGLGMAAAKGRDRVPLPESSPKSSPKLSPAACPPGPSAPVECFPARDTPFLVATLLSISGPDLPAGMLVYVGRTTMNQLRDEAGGDVGIDRQGLVLEVISGAGATRWGIPVGTALECLEVRDGMPVPESIVATDDWFVRGVKVLATPG